MKHKQLKFKQKTKGRGGLLNLAMELRKCCNHPFLMKNVEESLTKGHGIEDLQKVLVESSGKLILLDKLLSALSKLKTKTRFAKKLLNLFLFFC